ncbi:flagellar basal body-associated protein FliL [Pimelobacter simplex]|uniref:Flagellar protein FliL n=1 Tax=Nocardioides simplex TaxID=2045 RepID=A0A0C5XKY0_NOCSI|nr:flagellar basal body-associated FliL family protein [Pimelobacter simplex]AJR18152.1 Flagellar biosynthesis protein FliL [Pimelobacter simplex]KAB2808542.1 flagellar basal body-associated protein FliL [Pimelobacter simplex]MCG8153049.1 flagellar basal body-associated protein FliL [Pimelobacter simplex]SFN04485.1 flagellar FliL protein [Pimelobacter simplex]GEB12013.1 flagellar protein FliL [Pimelobacter simplex]
MSTTLAAPAAATEQPPAKGGRTRRIGIVVLLVAVLAGAGWFFVLKPGDSAPKPGEVVALESIQVNLAGGHYLRLGMALQLTASAKEADGSKALDAAIGVFSGLPVGEVNKPAVRETLRKQLEKQLEERYHGEVMEVYFTEFVTQ